MTEYNWDLIENLLRHAQSSGGESFKPREYAEQLAHQKSTISTAKPNLDDLKKLACDYEALLLKADFIAPRPEERGGNGENFVLTDRGQRLLNLLGNQQAREQLDAKGKAALVPEVFDSLPATAPIASR
ncbi:transcriptional regulator [Pseudomonas marincola]|uniref:transcriptional regulator n=1 Tax=Pseudomonas marincola TaxID=437900 RepID=UPI0008DFE0F4|nr:transcriptional regulator [Pseudomonas marincola]SFT38370.1 hypothetical protein SAMN05216264_101128 [Pseudomonas marincola]